MKKTAPARAKSAKDKPIWAKVVIGLRHLQHKTEELEALHPPPERGIRHCERKSPGAKSNARRLRQPHTL